MSEVNELDQLRERIALGLGWRTLAWGAFGDLWGYMPPFPHDDGRQETPNWITDTAAAMSLLEEWRKQDPRRYYTIQSQVDHAPFLCAMVSNKPLQYEIFDGADDDSMAVAICRAVVAMMDGGAWGVKEKT